MIHFHLPVGQIGPEGGAEVADERPNSDEDAGLCGSHAHIFEVDGHQRQQRSECREETKVERFGDQQFAIDRTAEEIVDDVRTAAYLLGGLLRLRVFGQIDLGHSGAHRLLGTTGIGGIDESVALISASATAVTVHVAGIRISRRGVRWPLLLLVRRRGVVTSERIGSHD